MAAAEHKFPAISMMILIAFFHVGRPSEASTTQSGTQCDSKFLLQHLDHPIAVKHRENTQLITAFWCRFQFGLVW